MGDLTIIPPFLVYLGDVTSGEYCKTGFGIADWSDGRATAQYRQHDGVVSAGLPDMSMTEARQAGVKSLIIGIAGVGGYIAESWYTDLVEAAEAGLDIVSGAHHNLADVPGLQAAARLSGARLVEVRNPAPTYPVGTGAKRTGKRLLTVGTDCALGKKYTALTIAREMNARGIDATFRATGQTGIMIAGGGIPIDSVVADFVSGAAEQLSPAAATTHWDVIEGQGSLIHPGYAAVTLGLLHGSQPDEIVLCHDPRRTHNMDSTHVKIPPLGEVVDMYLAMGRLTNPDIRCRAISLNTGGMTAEACAAAIEAVEQETGLIVFDPVATGVSALIDSLEA